MPLGHWNWKWNQARSNCRTYDQELLAGMLVPSSQSRRSNPIVWLFDQEPSFQKGPPPGGSETKTMENLRQAVQANCPPYPWYKERTV